MACWVGTINEKLSRRTMPSDILNCDPIRESPLNYFTGSYNERKSSRLRNRDKGLSDEQIGILISVVAEVNSVRSLFEQR